MESKGNKGKENKKMNKRLRALLDEINGLKTQVINLANEGKIEEAKAAKNELQAKQEEFDLLKDVMDPEGDGRTTMPDTALLISDPTTESNVTKDFANAVRNLPRMNNIMTEGVPADGGYTVPADIQTKINHYKEDHRSLRSLTTVENVKTNKGTRVYQTRTDVEGFEEVDENGKVPAMSEPKYEQVGYNIKDYAGYLPVSNDLLADSDANVESEIVNWIGRQSLATDNKKILDLVHALDEVDLKDLKGIKKAINVTLGSAYRAGARIVTNDDGLNWLDTLEDANKRPLLNPDPTEPNAIRLRIGAATIPVEVFPNADIPTVEQKIPFILGDLKEAFRIYDRQQTRLMASNVASVTGYNAFEQRGTLFRADMRADYKTVDNKAVVNGYITAGE